MLTLSSMENLIVEFKLDKGLNGHLERSFPLAKHGKTLTGTLVKRVIN